MVFIFIHTNLFVDQIGKRQDKILDRVTGVVSCVGGIGTNE